MVQQVPHSLRLRSTHATATSVYSGRMMLLQCPGLFSQFITRSGDLSPPAIR
jgi:hypothetical protein